MIHSTFPLFALLALLCAAVSGCTSPNDNNNTQGSLSVLITSPSPHSTVSGTGEVTFAVTYIAPINDLFLFGARLSTRLYINGQEFEGGLLNEEILASDSVPANWSQLPNGTYNLQVLAIVDYPNQDVGPLFNAWSAPDTIIVHN